MRKSFNFIKHILTKNWPVVIIIVIATFLRLYNLQEFITFLGDQGRDAIIFKRIVTLEHFPAIGAPSSIGQVFLGPFYYYFIAPFLLLFWFNPVGLAFGVAFWTIVGMIFAYYVLQKDVNNITALGFLLLVTFCYTLIDLSRFSWNPNLLPIFSFFTLYFFAKLLQEKKALYAIAFGSFFCLSFQLHHLAALLVIAPVLVGLYALIKEQHKIHLLKMYGLSVAAFLFFYAPLILFDIKNRFINTLSLIKVFTNKEGGEVAHSFFFIPLRETIHSFFRHILKVEISAALSVWIFFGLLFLCIVLWKKLSKNLVVLLLVLNFFTYIIAFSRLNSFRHAHYYGAAYMSFFVLIAYLTSLLPKKYLQYGAVALVTAGIFITNSPSYIFLFNKGPDQLRYAKSVADSFKGRVKAEPIQIVSEPSTETDGHFRYYLEIMNFKVLPYESAEQPKELFVICYKPNCEVLGNPQWQIASFSNKKIADKWSVENVTIYKVIQSK